jgi:hypothetical protein
MLITLRHICECTGKEMLTQTLIFDRAAGEMIFLHTMRQLYRDFEHEISIHLQHQKG